MIAAVSMASMGTYRRPPESSSYSSVVPGFAALFSHATSVLPMCGRGGVIIRTCLSSCDIHWSS